MCATGELTFLCCWVSYISEMSEGYHDFNDLIGSGFLKVKRLISQPLKSQAHTLARILWLQVKEADIE